MYILIEAPTPRRALIRYDKDIRIDRKGWYGEDLGDQHLSCAKGVQGRTASIFSIRFSTVTPTMLIILILKYLAK